MTIRISTKVETEFKDLDALNWLIDTEDCKKTLEDFVQEKIIAPVNLKLAVENNTLYYVVDFKIEGNKVLNEEIQDMLDTFKDIILKSVGEKYEQDVPWHVAEDGTEAYVSTDDTHPDEYELIFLNI